LVGTRKVPVDLKGCVRRKKDNLRRDAGRDYLSERKIKTLEGGGILSFDMLKNGADLQEEECEEKTLFAIVPREWGGS